MDPVILFVRMWVEILYRVPTFELTNKSSSSWGCELKCFPYPGYFRLAVILFVRMWVEICPWKNCTTTVTSSSSWGCELKYREVFPQRNASCHPLREDVSWNYGILKILYFQSVSSSSWGCELKYLQSIRRSVHSRHPLREDVSWNLEEYGVNHRCSNMVLLVGRWIEIFLIVFLSFARRSHYYTSFNLNIKLNYRNLRGNFYMCS